MTSKQLLTIEIKVEHELTLEELEALLSRLKGSFSQIAEEFNITLKIDDRVNS